ncbi:MAG: hypothetical protein H7832_10300 [Magnetococcus sp. DMHC-6]
MTLDDENSPAYPNLGRFIREAFKILRSGGRLILCTCSRYQQAEGYWWASLIPNALEKVCRRFPPLEHIETTFLETGFEDIQCMVPLHAVLQGENYLDPEGPLKESWRAGDSTWALASQEELTQALDTVRDLLARGKMRDHLTTKENIRRRCGQATFLAARKP